MTTNRPTPIIEVLFPGRRVHLVGGASGAGKTTWLMQTLEKWRKGESIFGYPSHPAPFVYLSYDRDRDDFEDTCERMGIDSSTYRFEVPAISELGQPIKMHLDNIMNKYPDTKLIVIEGVATMVPGGKIIDQQTVARFLRELQEFCKRHDITIIGVVHAAKTKERDRYREPRARIAGCGAWAGFSSTVVIIEEKQADSDCELRDLYILPRNSRKLRFQMDFRDGFLVESGSTSTESTQTDEQMPKFIQWLYRMPTDLPFIASDCREVSRAGFYRGVKQAIKDGIVQQNSNGTYQRI